MANRDRAGEPAPADGQEGDERRRRSSTFWVRKAHRWLGLIIGIQFAIWTASGIYFSWIPLSTVHGDHLRAPVERLPGDTDLETPAAALAALAPVDSLISIELVRVLDTPAWRIRYFTTGDGGAPERRTRLANAATGELLPPVGPELAVAIAERDVAFDAPVRSVVRLTEEDIGPHHEFRGGPTPVWAVHWDHESGARSYVPVEEGTVRTVRNTRWRAFDFLWMLHTMDYRSRDDFNNLLIRLFSVFAIVTIITGFVLFVLTSRPYRRRLGRRRRRDPG